MSREKAEIILEARDVYYAYEEGGPYSLKGINLKIHRGSKVAVIGANGCGKSTFFLCCNGIHKPEKGQMYFHGTPIDYSKRGLLDLRSKVGIVFQDPDNQLFFASVYQEISFGPMNLKLPETEVRSRVEQVIEELEIKSFQERPAHGLSGGEKKQVAIADILVMHPEVMILDEPTAALDARHTGIVNDIVDQLAEEGITILMATHDMDYALSWADEIVLMKDGKVLAQGDPISVCTQSELLKQANQRTPQVLILYEKLVKKGILPKGLKPPVSMKELEEYIDRCKYVQGAVT